MFPQPEQAQEAAANLAADQMQSAQLRDTAKQLAKALQEAPPLDDGGKVIEVPGNSASPEVIAKLRAMGVQVHIANRKKRRRIRAQQRRGAAPLPHARVFADGHAEPNHKRRQRNKAKAERRRRRK